ncbi:MAG: UvrD-helicase domain-containing protein [archaeon]
MQDPKAHALILGMLKDASIGMGRQLLAQCMTGELDDRIVKFKLNKSIYFNSLPLYDKKDILELSDIMMMKGLIELRPIPQNKFIKVLALTDRGEKELIKPELELSLRKDYNSYYSKIENVTEEDNLIFSKLGDLLAGLSDEQKKAVISTNEKILCIAGAGSGKTKVLTKRVWYLSKLRSIPTSKILAVTFTRKARQEMIDRLENLLPGSVLNIETFNSFCEGILRKHEDEIYSKKFRVMDYSTKIKLIMKILADLEQSIDSVLSQYYSDRKIMSNDKKTLFLGFVNDIFSVIDYQQNNGLDDGEIAKLLSDYAYILDIVQKIKEYKEKNGLRDFTDQMVHVIEFFRNNPDRIPIFEHLLIDEYQDINSLQYELISLLDPKNLFAVGDPRQSIYGWRGSRIEYVLDFESNHPGSQILQLGANYRSTEKIVSLCNKVISPMKLPALISSNVSGDDVSFIKHDSEDAENIFVCQSILSLDTKRKDIFVLARTNRQIEALSEKMKTYGIKSLKRTVEDMKTNKAPADDEVTVSTIHAIKGLEADIVYVIGANSKNHPCKASEHPVLESVKVNDSYDKFSEELRLMYVALSRARKKLIVSYTGSLCAYFEQSTNGKYKENKLVKNGSGTLYNELRGFRLEESQRLGIPAYQVFSDKTLQELCDDQPLNFEELSEVNGMGNFKIRRWGKNIIRIIRENS